MIIMRLGTSATDFPKSFNARWLKLVGYYCTLEGEPWKKLMHRIAEEEGELPPAEFAELFFSFMSADVERIRGHPGAVAEIRRMLNYIQDWTSSEGEFGEFCSVMNQNHWSDLELFGRY